MAQSVRSSSNAFVAEVARYLAVEPADVLRMVKVAKLPVLRIPKEKRHVLRIPLRDFHVWLLARTQNPTPELERFDVFMADFDQTVRTKKHECAV